MEDGMRRALIWRRLKSLLYIVCYHYYYSIHPAHAIVRLKSLPTWFVETPARFGGGFNGSEICGAVHIADPLDACSPPLNIIKDDSLINFALIVRGNCTFHHKIHNAQLAGFHAAIVFDHQLHHTNLISMIGRSDGIWAHAIFVSNAAGETLKKHARGEDGECCIITSPGEATWNVLMISFISLLVIATVLATLLWTRIYWRNRQRSSHLLGRNLVELLPCLTFSAAQISGYMGEICAICLESYQDGESLKLLACQHKFHADCVGSWLTNWNTCCPVCKYDLKTELHNLSFDGTKELLHKELLMLSGSTWLRASYLKINGVTYKD